MDVLWQVTGDGRQERARPPRAILSRPVMIGQAQPRDGEPESASDEGQNGDNERRKKKKK
jgi:hypothetical protein